MKNYKRNLSFHKNKSYKKNLSFYKNKKLLNEIWVSIKKEKVTKKFLKCYKIITKDYKICSKHYKKYFKLLENNFKRNLSFYKKIPKDKMLQNYKKVAKKFQNVTIQNNKKKS